MPDMPKTMHTLKPGEQASFCRCGQSTRLPFCDGSHREYEHPEGLSVGPLVIACKSERQ